MLHLIELWRFPYVLGNLGVQYLLYNNIILKLEDLYF